VKTAKRKAPMSELLIECPAHFSSSTAGRATQRWTTMPGNRVSLRLGIAPCRGDSTLRLSGAALLHIPTGPLDALSEAYQSGAVVDVDAGFAGIFVEIKRR
jgi:hypothetical protein